MPVYPLDYIIVGDELPAFLTDPEDETSYGVAAITTLRVRSELKGAHVHARFFMGQPGGTLASIGSLAMTVEDWESLSEVLLRGSKNTAIHLDEDKALTDALAAGWERHRAAAEAGR